jgi:hypothetical protein
MSTISALGAAALLRVSGVAAFGAAGAVIEDGELEFGVAVVTGWAITGAAIVNANSPMGSRENFNISFS